MSIAPKSPATAIVFPCYNEAGRLAVAEFERFLDGHEILFILVDDGSRDKTREVLERIRRGRESRVEVLPLERNRGKAEAVRLGMAQAFERPFAYVGFWDADLATPLDAIPPFVELLERRPEIDMVFGARVKLLGRDIRRHASRHYLGRLFATAVSQILRMPIYDTQCGAKLFRANAHTRAAFSKPFLSRWIFDVEVIARCIEQVGSPCTASEAIYEFPLLRWEDMQGSKLKGADFGTAALDLSRIWWTYRMALRGK